MPVLADSLGRRLFIEQPIVAEVRTGTLVVGSPVLNWPPLGRDAFEIVGVVLNRAGTTDTVLRPKGITRLQGPRLLSQTRGVAEIVWGTSADTTITGRRLMDTLWYATFDGRSWSQPQRLMHGHKLLWDSFAPAVMSAAGQTLVAVTGPYSPDSSNIQRLWISRLASGEWETVSPVEARGFMALQQVRMVSADSGAIVLVYSGFTYTPSGSGRRAYVNVIRSTDDGRTWSPPQTVSLAPDATMAVLGGLHRRQDGSLHLFWHAQQDGTFGSKAVYHDVSRDGGSTWLRSDTLAVQEQFSVLRTAQAGDAVVLTVRTLDDRLLQGLASKHAELKLLSASPVILLPTVVVRGDQSVETWWGRNEPLSLRDSSTYGVGYTSYRTTTHVVCPTKAVVP